MSTEKSRNDCFKFFLSIFLSLKNHQNQTMPFYTACSKQYIQQLSQEEINSILTELLELNQINKEHFPLQMNANVILHLISEEDTGIVLLILKHIDPERFEEVFGVTPMDYSYSIFNLTRKLDHNKITYKCKVPLPFLFLNNCKEIFEAHINGDDIQNDLFVQAKEYVADYFHLKIRKLKNTQDIEDLIIRITREENHLMN